MSRIPSHIILTPAMQKRLSKERKRPPKSNQEQIDLKSIRERRERLEAMIQSHRLPPLAPPATSSRGGSSGSQRSSRMSLSPHWKEKKDHQPRKERQPTPQPKRSSVRLTPMPSRGGSHHDPLPEIKQQKVQEENDEDSRPPTEDFLQEIHQQMTFEMQQLMQHQMQKMQQLLQQKKEQQMRKKQRQEQLEQQLMQQRAQEAQAKENQMRTSQEETQLTDAAAGEGGSSDNRESQAPEGSADETHKTDATGLKEDKDVREEEKEDISGEVLEIVEGIRGSSDAERQLQCAKRARVLLSSSVPPIDQLLQAGVLPALVLCMARDDRPELQLEAAWAVTNIASGTSQHTRAVVDAGAVDVLVRVLSSRSVSVKEQAVWALGNVVGDGAECRDAAVKAGIVPPLTSLLDLNMPSSLRRQVCWVITTLFWVKEPKMSPEERRLCALALKKLVNSLDTQVQADALWGTAHFADMGPTAVNELVKVGLVKDMVQRLYSDNERVITSALRATGSIAAGTHEQTDAVVKAGALPIYRDLLSHSNPGIAREAAWILSNITAGTVTQIQLVIDVQVVPALISAVEREDAELRKEATWALSNMTCGCTTEQVALLVSSGVVSTLCDLLACDDPGILLVVLDAIGNVFKKTEDEASIIRVMEAHSGLPKLKTLETHKEAQVSKMAKYLITSYFDGYQD